MLEICRIDPTGLPNAQRIREAQAEIARGFHAIVLHPKIDIRYCRRIARCTYTMECRSVLLAVMDEAHLGTTDVRQLDHIQSIVTYGSHFDLTECKEFMADMGMKTGDKLDSSLLALATCPFSQYILDRCAGIGLKKFPIPLSAVHRTLGMCISCMCHIRFVSSFLYGVM